jgi:Holliday junction DNA helicase RuvB
MVIDVSEKDIESLGKIRAWEEAADEEHMKLGWQWFDVGVHMGTINKLLTMGLVERTYSSRSAKHHKLTDKAKIIMDGEADAVQEAREAKGEPNEDMYAHMFDDIVGYVDQKELIRESLQLDKPVHVLFYGPPAIAKTMFLSDIERVLGQSTMWMIGSATSKAGLWDGVAENRPKVILIDEIEKMTMTDSASLLSLMEKGRLVRTKVHRKLDVQLTVWVIATANRIHKMSTELLSRFKVCEVKEYSAVEFRNVVVNALTIHEGTDANSAAEIATRLVGKTHDVRDAIRVARLSKRVGVQRAVELIMT